MRLYFNIFCVLFLFFIIEYFILGSKDPIARKMRLRRRRDQEEADQDQAKILKVFCYFNIFFYIIKRIGKVE